MKSPIFERTAWWLWLALLISLPFTSAPLVVAILEWNPVSPLALLPLAVLIVVWLIPYLAKGGSFARLLVPMGAFSLVVLISAVLAHSISRLSSDHLLLIKEQLLSLAALGVGLSFLATASKLPNSETRLRSSLRAISIGGLMMLIWSSIQANYVLAEGPRVPLSFTQLHHLFSIRDPIYNRVSGFAFEPSWLGNQLMILYIPVWLSAAITGNSAFPKIRGKFSFELILFAWASAMLILTQSRISYVSAALVILLLSLVFIWRASDKIRLTAGNPIFVRGALIAMAGLALIAGVIASAWVASRFDKRLSVLFDLGPRIPEIRAFYLDEAGFEIANRLAFAERMMYWAAGFRTFEQYPIMGVGLGNSGLLFGENVPAFGYRLEEIQVTLDPGNPVIPNPKALWVRLLAETGIVGFSIFIVWLIVIGAVALQLWRRGAGTIKWVGLVGIVALLAQVVEGFNVDSFALPYLWITLGLVVAADTQLQKGVLAERKKES